MEIKDIERTYKNVPTVIVNLIEEKYGWFNIIINNGDIYYTLKELPTNKYRQYYREYLAKRIKFNLELGENTYLIKEHREFDSERHYEGSTYEIEMKEGE